MRLVFAIACLLCGVGGAQDAIELPSTAAGGAAFARVERFAEVRLEVRGCGYDEGYLVEEYLCCDYDAGGRLFQLLASRAECVYDRHRGFLTAWICAYDLHSEDPGSRCDSRDHSFDDALVLIYCYDVSREQPAAPLAGPRSSYHAYASVIGRFVQRDPLTANVPQAHYL